MYVTNLCSGIIYRKIVFSTAELLSLCDERCCLSQCHYLWDLCTASQITHKHNVSPKWTLCNASHDVYDSFLTFLYFTPRLTSRV